MTRSNVPVKFLHSSTSSSVPLIVPGYTVNVHDAINFDIDLFLTSQHRTQFRHVITNEYQYKEESSSEEIKTGKVYRCRLKGIKVSDHNSRKSKSQMHAATRDVRHATDRSNGWVICIIYDVDVYNRLLVDILDPKTQESLKEFLLSDYDIFIPYIPHTYEEKRSQKW